MADIYTRATVAEVRLVPEGGPIGPFIEYPMRLAIRDFAALDEHLRRLVVFVQPVGDDGGVDRPITVELFRPGSDTPLAIPSDADRARGGGAAAAADVSPARQPDTGRVAGTQLVLGAAAALRRPGLSGALIGRPGGLGGLGGITDGVIIDVGPIDPLPPPDPDPHRHHHLFTDGDPAGEWRVRITNRGSGAATRRILIHHPQHQLPLRETRIPRAIIDRLLAKVLTLADIEVVLGTDAVLTFGEEFSELTGQQQFLFPIGKFEVGPFGNDTHLRDVRLERLDIGISRAVDDAITLEFDLEFETGGRDEIDINNAPNIDITELGLSGRLRFDGPAPAYSERRDLDGGLVGASVPSGALGLEIDPVAIDTSSFTGRVRDKINGKIQTFTRSASTRRALANLSEYVTDALMFAAIGDETALFHDVSTTADHLVVRHYARPDSRMIRLFPSTEVTEATTTMRLLTAVQPRPSSGPRPTTTPVRRPTRRSRVDVTVAPSAPGDLVLDPSPDGHVTPPSGIDHIVVLMLENRSYDHMLGFLTLERGRDDLDGVPGHGRFRNPVPGTGGSQTHTTFTIRDPRAIVVDPSHGVSATAEQLAGGAMSGFVRSYFAKSAVKADPGSEALVMGIYDHEHLTVFDDLAREFMVCDRWFASHPGPTYPNRFVSLQGSAPSIDNFAVDSGVPGTIDATTIFDVLTDAGVSWHQVESNISFLRMYDRYRIDDERIIQRDRWLDLARSGRLPAVSWIDPHIGDLELDWDADDDHPPADIRQGQGGVKEIYDALTNDADQWLRTMLIVTYDEHGGFHDHVPPHGADGRSLDPSLRIHPDGADHYGLRVPALVVSPLVAAGSVSHEVYDHTSILKTILANFAPQLVGTGALGARTDAANSLLDALSGQLRTDRPTVTAAAIDEVQTRRSNERFERDSFHLGMRLFGLGPKLRREVAAQIAR